MSGSFQLFTEGVTQLQVSIMHFVSDWARSKKTPIPQKEIVEHMKQTGVKDFTTVNAISGLLKKGYIRKAYTISNRVTYVQLRMIERG